MVIAFVMSGGGSLGEVQVGMLQALTARGVAPDGLSDTSAGADVPLASALQACQGDRAA